MRYIKLYLTYAKRSLMGKFAYKANVIIGLFAFLMTQITALLSLFLLVRVVPNIDGYSMYGYESGITYVVAYCAEDINGVVGPVKFATATTTEAIPGPNPIVEFEMIEYDDANHQVIANLKTNQDAKMVKYFGISASDGELYSSCALYELVNGTRRGYEEYLTLWESQLIQLGLDSNAESVTVGVDAAKNSEQPVLVAAVAIGEDNGEDVYSPVICKIYHKGQFKDLSDFRTPKN